MLLTFAYCSGVSGGRGGGGGGGEGGMNHDQTLVVF